MIQTHSAVWLMSNERPETGEAGLNFLPVLYYYSAGGMSQGKVVVSGSLRYSNKIITTDKQRNLNQWRALDTVILSIWLTSRLFHECALTFCTFINALETLYYGSHNIGVFFLWFQPNYHWNLKVTRGHSLSHAAIYTYKQSSRQIRQDLSPTELLSGVFLYH